MTRRKYCATEDCKEPVEAPGRRFCTPHRQAHARKLQAQLQAVVDLHREIVARRG